MQDCTALPFGPKDTFQDGNQWTSHLERCLLVQTAELYSPGKYVNWNLSFFNAKPMIAMENFQSDLSGRTGTVQVKSGMSIDSHLERCLLVQTAELYSPGKYVNWNLSFCMGNSYNSYGEFSKWPVRPYRNCTGQVWYVHWFPSWKVSFGPNGRAVQSWEVCMLTGIWVFQWKAYDIAMENFQSDLSGRTGTVQVKSGMSIDSHLERCLLVWTAELYSLAKYVNWNLSFCMGNSYNSYG